MEVGEEDVDHAEPPRRPLPRLLRLARAAGGVGLRNLCGVRTGGAGAPPGSTSGGAASSTFGLDEVVSEPYPAEEQLAAEDVAANTSLLQNVRLWDPPVLAEAYEQLQAIRPYYAFPDVDIDRYEIGGRTRQVLLSARELSLEHLEERSQNWTNLKLQYTHGYGLVASLTNERTSAGQPSFLVKDVPGTVTAGAESLAADEPTIYFGEAFEPYDFSIVNTNQEEIDYPVEDGVDAPGAYLTRVVTRLCLRHLQSARVQREAIFDSILPGSLEATQADAPDAHAQLADALAEALLAQGLSSYRDLRRFVADRPGHDRRYAIDAGKVRHELGWEPRHSFEEGMRATVAWYLANGAWCAAVLGRGYGRERLGLPTVAEA